jgi:protein-L-isoaspartate O-methyltransferase
MATQKDLVDALRRTDGLPLDWRATVAAVDRAQFIPDVFDGHDRNADPDGWAKAVYSDRSIVTQVNGGTPTGDAEFRLATSSSSQPSIMLEMLHLLDVRPGQRVLEVGAGTGYNAAWLGHRLGDGNVVTVEIDASVAETASANLNKAGFNPAVVVGDGRAGDPGSAPFDRIICTYSIRDTPADWLRQCPNGRIVAPWGSSFYDGSFVTLTVKNGIGTGRFSGDPAFMSDRTTGGGTGRITDLYRAGIGEQSTTTVPPQSVVQDDPAFFIGLVITDAWYRWCNAEDDSGEATLWFLSDAAGEDQSGAKVEYLPGTETYDVEQFGPRRLWDEVQSAYQRWEALGRPPRAEFGLTATVDGQQVWLNNPNACISLPSQPASSGVIPIAQAGRLDEHLAERPPMRARFRDAAMVGQLDELMEGFGA